MLIENLLFLREYFLSFFNVLPPESLQSNKEKEKKHMQMIPKQNKVDSEIQVRPRQPAIRIYQEEEETNSTNCCLDGFCLQWMCFLETWLTQVKNKIWQNKPQFTKEQNYFNSFSSKSKICSLILNSWKISTWRKLGPMSRLSFQKSVSSLVFCVVRDSFPHWRQFNSFRT